MIISRISKSNFLTNNTQYNYLLPVNLSIFDFWRRLRETFARRKKHQFAHCAQRHTFQASTDVVILKVYKKSVDTSH